MRSFASSFAATSGTVGEADAKRCGRVRWATCHAGVFDSSSALDALERLAS